MVANGCEAGSDEVKFTEHPTNRRYVGALFRPRNNQWPQLRNVIWSDMSLAGPHPEFSPPLSV
ncbi:: Bac_transf [Gemmata massiliana]|uniref:: Bac_transf n=1 Tax=Gemmata massiliana TaxID=1210884 RepID=A0A6P2D316_9BACT|nr:: Bac_transf [Gemmata massiliana]